MKLEDMPERLLGPEFYMETEGNDVRLSVVKINDFLETLGDATISLIYSGEEEHKNTEEFLLNIIRRIHIRHAIIDLNNCFDILLQVIWFHYRIWVEFNTGGRYYNPQYHKPKDDVVRNKYRWVDKAESICNYDKVLQFLKCADDEKLNLLANEFEKFNMSFRFNNSKNVLVRIIANQMKHKHNIRLKEFNKPYKFDLEINNIHLSNIKEKNLGISVVKEFYDKSTRNDLGEIIIKYEDDLQVDIRYYSGEKFLGKDLTNTRDVYAINDVINEMIDYRSSIIELYREVYQVIEENIQINPFMKVPEIINKTEYDLDSFFKESNS